MKRLALLLVLITSAADGQIVQNLDVRNIARTDGVIPVGDGTRFVGESGSTLRKSLGLATMLVVEGDSNSADSTDWPSKLATYSPWLARGELTNHATGGDFADEMTGQYATQAGASPPGASDIAYFFLMAGTVDIGSRTAAADIYADLQTLWAAAEADGFIVVAFTVLPADGWDAEQDAIQVALNALIRGDRTEYDYLVDGAAIAELADSTDTTYWNVDALHLNETGAGVLAAEVARVLRPSLKYDTEWFDNEQLPLGNSGVADSYFRFDGTDLDIYSAGHTTFLGGDSTQQQAGFGICTSASGVVGYIEAGAGLLIDIDDDNNGTGGYFAVRANNDTAQLFQVAESGTVSLPADNQKLALGAAGETDSYLTFSGLSLKYYTDRYHEFNTGDADYGVIVRSSGSDNYWAGLGANTGYAWFGYKTTIGGLGIFVNEDGTVSLPFDNQKLALGAAGADDLALYYDGTQGVIDSTGGLQINDTLDLAGTPAYDAITFGSADRGIGVSGTGDLVFWANASDVIAFGSDSRIGAKYVTIDIGNSRLDVDLDMDVDGPIEFIPDASATPSNNGDLVVEATSNTTLTFKLKGTDGTVRSGTLTLAP